MRTFFEVPKSTQTLISAAGFPMTMSSLRSKWQQSEIVVPVAIAVVLLFFGSVVVDEILRLKGIVAAETFLNDIAIAAMGGFTVWILLSVQATRQEMRRARERMQITIDLNRQVREAFSKMANSLMLKTEEDRLRVVDETMQHVDRLLSDLVPKAAAAAAAASKSSSGSPAPVTSSFRVPFPPDVARRN
jgi:hypothetical protein